MRCNDVGHRTNVLHAEIAKLNLEIAKLDAQINDLRLSESDLWSRMTELYAAKPRAVDAPQRDTSVDAPQRGRSATQSASTAKPRAVPRKQASTEDPEYDFMQEQLRRAMEEEKEKLETAHQKELDEIKEKYKKKVECAELRREKELDLLWEKYKLKGVQQAQRLAKARSRSPNPNLINKEIEERERLKKERPVSRTPSP